MSLVQCTLGFHGAIAFHNYYLHTIKQDNFTKQAIYNDRNAPTHQATYVNQANWFAQFIFWTSWFAHLLPKPIILKIKIWSLVL
jgi:hypothetical protein